MEVLRLKRYVFQEIDGFIKFPDVRFIIALFFMLFQVFVTLSLFHNVRNLMMNCFPNGVLQVAEAKVAISRIQVLISTNHKC